MVQRKAWAGIWEKAPPEGSRAPWSYISLSSGPTLDTVRANLGVGRTDEVTGSHKGLASVDSYASMIEWPQGSYMITSNIPPGTIDCDSLFSGLRAVHELLESKGIDWMYILRQSTGQTVPDVNALVHERSVPVTIEHDGQEVQVAHRHLALAGVRVAIAFGRPLALQAGA